MDIFHQILSENCPNFTTDRHCHPEVFCEKVTPTKFTKVIKRPAIKTSTLTFQAKTLLERALSHEPSRKIRESFHNSYNAEHQQTAVSELKFLVNLFKNLFQTSLFQNHFQPDLHHDFSSKRES